MNGKFHFYICIYNNSNYEQKKHLTQGCSSNEGTRIDQYHNQMKLVLKI